VAPEEQPRACVREKAVFRSHLQLDRQVKEKSQQGP
jgi:hypothetical protein